MMAKKCPYEEALEAVFAREDVVTIDRRDTSPVKGRVGEIGDEGVHLTSYEGAARGMVKHTYVAYEDIRGITTESPGLEE
jgi:hypothetical protein